MKRQYRPIGARILAVCELLELHGPSDYARITARMSVGNTNAGHYLGRAVKHGFATVEIGSPRRVYTIVPGWRERAASEPPRKRKTGITALPRPVHPLGVNSVWQLGARV